ncbi:MAG: PAS domain S-box protein [Bacteroidetes bacterium]|nr:PAS domain S-box protein [Bacteroidota bacterium]
MISTNSEPAVGIEICILIIGVDDERRRSICEILEPHSSRLYDCPSESDPGQEGEIDECLLVVLADTDQATLDTLDRMARRIAEGMLVLACIPKDEFLSSQKLLEGCVDDVMFSVEELGARMPFIRQRIRMREKSQKQYRSIFETIVDGIITIDEKGKITEFNTAAENIFGYKADDSLGKSISMLMPHPYGAEHQSYVQEYLRTGDRHVIGIGREVVGVRKNGESFPMDLAVSEVRAEGKILFTGVIRDITERRLLEHEILRISDQERRSIGHDLHDGLGQMLTGIGLIAQNLSHRLADEGSACADEMVEITELIKEADRSARSLSRGMVPVELGELGLGNALQMLVRNAEKLFGISCTLETSGSIRIRDISSDTNLYRIAQEAVSNAVKHGKASHVHILLSARDHRIHLTIRDDGIGFPDELPEDRGMGVRIMKYRARVMGATLEIRKGSRGGTIVSCILPSI